jgi:methionine aminopeptidase
MNQQEKNFLKDMCDKMALSTTLMSMAVQRLEKDKTTWELCQIMREMISQNREKIQESQKLLD